MTNIFIFVEHFLTECSNVCKNSLICPFPLPLLQWAQFTFLLTCRYQSLSDPTESIFSLLSHKSICYFLVCFFICGLGKQQQLREVRQSTGQGLEPGGEGEGTARQILLVYPAGDPRQRGFFSISVTCVFAVLCLHSLSLFFSIIIFSVTLELIHMCEVVHLCTIYRFHYGSVLCFK